MTMNFFVLSYLIVSRKQQLIQHDAMNTKVGYLASGITKQFLQHIFRSNEIEDNCLIKILSEVHKSQKLQTRIIPPRMKQSRSYRLF